MTKGTGTYNGLRRRAHYEEVLAAALAQQKPGELPVGMQKFATKMINSLLYQRHQEGISSTLEEQQRNIIEHRTYENHVHQMAQETKLNRDDVQWLVGQMSSNMPPPPPPAASKTMRDSSTQYEGAPGTAAGTQTSSDGMPISTQTDFPGPQPPPAAVKQSMSTQTGQPQRRDMFSQSDAPPPPSAPPQNPSPLAAMIPQTSPEIIENFRKQAELDQLLQAEAAKASMAPLAQQVKQNIENQFQSPARRVIDASHNFVAVPKAKSMPSIRPDAKIPKFRPSPYDQIHGVDPGLVQRQIEVYQSRKPPPLAEKATSSSDKRKPDGGGERIKVKKTAIETKVPKDDGPVEYMTNTDKRPPPDDDGDKPKKKKTVIQEKRFAKPIPAQARKPKMQQYAKEEIPTEEPEQAKAKKQKQVTEVAIVPAKQQVKKPHFVKPKLVGLPKSIPKAEDVDPGELSVVTRGAKFMATVGREKMRDLYDSARKKVAQTRTGLVMGAMIQHATTGRRRDMKNFKGQGRRTALRV